MVKKKAVIVIGLGYGDEGKGLTTDYLCLKNNNSIVVRFNGGHQAGHCVVTKNGEKHIFSNFGSGTLRNIPTYWSNYCTVAPTFFLEELSSLEFNTKVYIDNDCPVTTHYDILYNRAMETTLGKKRNGSCGVGFGATMERQKKSISLQFKDLFNTEILLDKLEEIKRYYRHKVNLETAFDFDSFDHSLEDNYFIQSVNEIKDLAHKGFVVPISESEMFTTQKEWSTYIFEGAQGVLLDQVFGSRPHITKSNTTSKNAFEIINRQKLDFLVEVWYVTRAYQTRHGEGPFRQQHIDFELINTHTETNKLNDYQGNFKVNFLDIDDLNYAIKCDSLYSKKCIKNLMITCLDQLKSENITFFKDNNLDSVHFTSISKKLNCNFKDIVYSFSNCAENILID